MLPSIFVSATAPEHVNGAVETHTRNDFERFTFYTVGDMPRLVRSAYSVRYATQLTRCRSSCECSAQAWVVYRCSNTGTGRVPNERDCASTAVGTLERSGFRHANYDRATHKSEQEPISLVPTLPAPCHTHNIVTPSRPTLSRHAAKSSMSSSVRLQAPKLLRVWKRVDRATQGSECCQQSGGNRDITTGDMGNTHYLFLQRYSYDRRKFMFAIQHTSVSMKYWHGYVRYMEETPGCHIKRHVVTQRKGGQVIIQSRPRDPKRGLTLLNRV